MISVLSAHYLGHYLNQKIQRQMNTSSSTNEEEKADKIPGFIWVYKRMFIL